MRTSDEVLYTRTKHGDRQAFEELYERREPGLFRYALHMSGSRMVAEEVVHEAFLGLLQPAGRFDPTRGSLEAYMYGTVRNLVRAARRSWNPEPETEAVIEHDIVGAMIGNERTAALHAALQELPPPFRDVVVMCDLEERSYDEAARLLECPVGTVRSRLHRARAALATKLKSLRLPTEAAAR